MLRQFSRNSHKRVRVIVPPPVVTGGNGGSGSILEGLAFTSSLQPLTPHFSWWNHKYTDFYYGWTLTERDWAARHMDSLMSGNAGAFRTGSANTTGQHSAYSLIYTTINTGTTASATDVNTSWWGGMMAWYADPTKNTLGGLYENGFLHYKDGATRAGTGKLVSNIAISNPAVLTVASHGFTSGNRIEIIGAGLAGIPDGNYTATVVDVNTLTLPIAATAVKVNTGTISNQLGDGTKTSANRKVAVLYQGKVDRWATNFGDASMRAYQLFRTQQIVNQPNQTGVFWDELGTGGSGLQKVYLSVEYPLANTMPNGGPYNNGFAQYMTDLRTCLTSISASISPKEQWINPAGYYNFVDDQANVAAAGFGHFELTLRADNTNDFPTMDNYVLYNKLAKAPGYEMVGAYYWTDIVGGNRGSGSSGAYTADPINGRTIREKASCWIQGWMSMPGDLSQRKNIYINLNNYWSYAPSTAWLPMWERDIGLPIAATFNSDPARNINQPRTVDNTTYWSYDSSSIDSLGARVKVRARETSKALLLYRGTVANADGASGATKIASQSRNEATATINLPIGYKWGLLETSGSIIPLTSNSINLCGGEGVVLMKTPFTNEPAGFTTIQDWTMRNQGAWRNSSTGTTGSAPTGNAGPWTWVFDNTVQDTVTRLTYGPWAVPTGSTYGPGHGYIPISTGLGIKSFYLSFSLRLSSNWVYPTGPDQKLFQMFTNNAGGYNIANILYGAYGTGSNPKFMVYENNASQPGYNGVPLGQNPSGATFVTPPPDVVTFGIWHKFEMLCGGNTPGSPDGWFVTWLDGKQQTQVNNMQWTNSGTTEALYQFDLNPLWGGQGGTLTTAQFMDIGPIHLSGTTLILPHP